MIKNPRLLSTLSYRFRRWRQTFQIPSLFVPILLGYISVWIVGGLVVALTYVHEEKQALLSIGERIQQDIRYDNGQWDLSVYNADSRIPSRFRISIFTVDGVVIERWRPINGFLDVSDFQKFLTYQTPTTVHTITNQEWRMYSLPLTNSAQKTIGVITVSYFSPQSSEIAAVDKTLQEAAEKLRDQVVVTGDMLESGAVSSRSVPYTVSFQIVDQYNRIVFKSRNFSSINQIPDSIDASYVRQAMQATGFKQVQDTNTHSRFLSHSRLIEDEAQGPVGIIVVAITLELLYTVLGYSLLAGIPVVILALFLTWRFLTQLISRLTPASVSSQPLRATELKRLSFSKETGVLQIQDQQIPFTYATNQYYFCQALFSFPKKKWENDELLEKFGEEEFDKNGWRKVYDAMTAINRKTAPFLAEKLIIIDNKTYRINPHLTPTISKS